MTVITPQSHRIRLPYTQGLSLSNRQSQVLRYGCAASQIHDFFHSPSSPHYASMADNDPLTIHFLHELSSRPGYVQDAAHWLQRPPWPPHSRVQPCCIFRVSLWVLGQYKGSHTVAGRHHEMVPPEDQQGIGPKNADSSICGNRERSGRKYFEHGPFQPTSPGFRKAKLP